ncbi:kinesin-like protein KIN-7O isoform X2 [Amaranthus tricolor]|uniref:kinesin-like protein KIN-7O isoform X2 n=1 Tax=Amaranthus tricolor TaxID=29722 RepID=UPI00258AA0AB|nr:kinesin-like protein KIN-7O isoform X2 [Amaranthus tricolor]
MERIYVTVRARPLSTEDAKSSPWKISGNSISFLNSSSKFDFDKVFGEECKTKEVYEARTQEIVSAAVSGFNGTVFAYGQTNSGKTHTMRGSSSEPGVIPLAVRELFDIIHEVPDREFLLRMSYLEIYNEEINDLLVPEHRRLQIHESLDRGIYVAGLREEIVASPDQVLDLMEFGESHRHIGETNMNLYSSRSHTIFRMIIESRDKSGDEESSDSCDAVRVSVLNLVDLAGSERAAKTGAEGVRLKEGSHINKSLMTLGTVIKKLSEGAESQGGHVPYRDSKLTRILQPSLGGNANTAIICNITLAQIHADETKSSLQFASRALQVTNCAHVNEILTDAALLKRQKKEIEQLRAKLQASPSEHLEEEILNLRNTLLQTELERERIALELEEEKRAQVEREKMLEQQAKKIKNLSSMVLYSNRDEIRDHPKKDKRRDTWCPGKVTREAAGEASHMLDSRASSITRQECDQRPLIPFEELVTESEAVGDVSSKSKENNDKNNSGDCVLPDPCTLLNVTSRRKMPQKKTSLPMENHELHELQAAYEDLFVKSEIQRIMYEVQFDCLKRTLSEACAENLDHSTCPDDTSQCRDNSTQSLDTDATNLIEQLREQIKVLEVEKLSSEQNLESVVDFAKKQNTFAAKKCDELYEELQTAKQEALEARSELRLRNAESMEESNLNSTSELLLEVQQICEEVQSLSPFSEYISSVTEELLQGHSYALKELSNLKSDICESTRLQRSIVNDHGKLISSLKNKIVELENEKVMLKNQSTDLQEQLDGVRIKSQDSEKALMDLSEQYDAEKSELLFNIEFLEKEVYSLSSSSLSREKESLRKDLEKTKAKLKETESKLKNVMQEKTRLEGERANADREIKKLHSQKAFLERDLSKRDSLAGRKRESCVDRSRAIDSKRIKGQENIMQQTLQDDYKKLEVLAFEMETTIASLEEELAAANQEKEKLLATNESLSSEIEMLSEKFDASSSDLNALQEELLDLRLKLEKSESSNQNLESQINLLVEEKEELAMQLTNSLLELEEERAVWSAKEKASVEAIKEKANVYNDEITSLSNELERVQNEMISLKKEYEALQQSLKYAEEHAESKMRCSMEKLTEINQLKHALEVVVSEKGDHEELFKSKLDALSSQHGLKCEELKRTEAELANLKKEQGDLLCRIKEQEQDANLSNDLQNCKRELQFMVEERDKMKAQIAKMLENEIDIKLMGQNYDEKLFTAQHEAEQLSRRLAELEQTMRVDKVKENIERTKQRMRLRSMQAILDALRERYKKATDEQEIMHKKFEEAATKLKDRLASYALEVLNLKKQLADAC